MYSLLDFRELELAISGECKSILKCFWISFYCLIDLNVIESDP